MCDYNFLKFAFTQKNFIKNKQKLYSVAYYEVGKHRTIAI